MDRENMEAVDLIDLGVASEETQGTDHGEIDSIGLIPMPGLSGD
jgi:hypothetical protein